MEMMGPKVLVMGVAGSGKSTLAAELARELAATLIEGDDHHLPQSQDKMRSGIALQDADRDPWLGRLGDLLAAELGPAVLTCSALKRRYRERLRTAVPALRTVYIDIPPEHSRARVAARPGHGFPPGLVASQFDALEVPAGEPAVLKLPAQQSLTAQVQTVLSWLNEPQDHKYVLNTIGLSTLDRAIELESHTQRVFAARQLPY